MAVYQFKDEIEIPLQEASVTGNLNIPMNADAIVIFAHSGGSSRLSPRNQFVAKALNDAGFATLLFDLLTPHEEDAYANRFKIDLLTDRLLGVTHWLTSRPDFELNLAYFGASTGAAATLEAAAHLGTRIRAVVSRGGRPDLAMYSLPQVKSPTSLIVGGLDHDVIGMNQKAYCELNASKELVIIEGATQRFEEPGTLHLVAAHAIQWFQTHLRHVYADSESI